MYLGGATDANVSPEEVVEHFSLVHTSLYDLFWVRFEKIHPFDDYNGRVGRLIMVKECLRHNIIPFIVDDKHRGSYNKGIF